MTTSEPTATDSASYECQECGFKGDVEIINKTVTCPVCATVNDVWKDGETPPPNHRGEPSTGELIEALRCDGVIKSCEGCFFSFQIENCAAMGCRTDDMFGLAADRLESQERDLETLRAFHERYAEQTSKQYVVAVCGLTARAEQAEAREKAAIKDLESIRTVHSLCGICSNIDERGVCTIDDCDDYYCMFKYKRRGQPQEGE